MLHTMLRGDTQPGPAPDPAEQTTILPALGDTLDLVDEPNPQSEALAGPPRAASANATTDRFLHISGAVAPSNPSPDPSERDHLEPPAAPAVPVAEPRHPTDPTEPGSAQWSWFTPVSPVGPNPEPVPPGESPTYSHDPKDVEFLERLLRRLRRL